MQAFDLVIVGAGIVGTSTAFALKDAQLRVALVEPQSASRAPDHRSWDNRVYTVSPGNAAWLDLIGVWSILPQERLTRVESMYVYGDRSSAGLEFHAYDAGMRELAYVVENRQLQHALWNRVGNASHVSLYSGARCADIIWANDAARLVLENGEELSARLVVGADGAESAVRLRAGIEQEVYDYGQLGVVANFATERDHGGVAFQWFHADDVLALLPLPDKRVSMVWSAPEARARELLAATPERLGEEVRHASADAVGKLELLAPAAAFGLKRQRVAHFVGPRVALIGDAAHSVHPLAGQGVNLGLRDARELAAVLTQRGPHTDCGAYPLLRRYERARKEDIIAMELTTHGLQKLFSSGAVLLTALRNAGLTLVDAQPWLKNALVRHAAA